MILRFRFLFYLTSQAIPDGLISSPNLKYHVYIAA